MAQEMRVDTSALNADIADMRRLLGDARKQLKTTCEEIEALRGMWTGAAALNFMMRFSRNYSNTEQIFDTIEFMIEHMEYARQQYDACEGEVQNKIQAIHIG